MKNKSQKEKAVKEQDKSMKKLYLANIILLSVAICIFFLVVEVYALNAIKAVTDIDKESLKYVLDFQRQTYFTTSIYTAITYLILSLFNYFSFSIEKKTGLIIVTVVSSLVIISSLSLLFV